MSIPTLTSMLAYRHSFLISHQAADGAPVAEIAEIVTASGTPVLTFAMAETLLASLQAAGVIETYRGAIEEVTGAITTVYSNPNAP